MDSGKCISPWDNFIYSDPLADIEKAREKVLLACGKKPNLLVMSKKVLDIFLNHPLVVDFHKEHSRRIPMPPIHKYRIEGMLGIRILLNEEMVGNCLVIYSHNPQSNDDYLREVGKFGYLIETGIK